MEESSSQTSTPSTFDIPEDQGYAMTDSKTCVAIEFLLTKLEPVNISDLGRKRRKCGICREKYHVSTDVTLAHTPVKTSCGHIFGRKCIIKHLDPLCFYSYDERPIYDEDPSSDEQPTTDERPRSAPGSELRICNSSCPRCARIFYPAPDEQPLQSLRTRLWIWDMAYASAEMARSARETRSRALLWDYVLSCEPFEDVALTPRTPYYLVMEAYGLLMDFARALHSPPPLEPKRKLLVRAAELGLRECDLAMTRLFG